MRRIVTLLAAALLAIASLNAPASVAYAGGGPCITIAFTELESETRLILMADAPISRLEFHSFINMQVNVLGGHVDDFPWPLPTKTTKLSFQFQHYDAGKYASVAAKVYDSCGEYVGDLVIEVYPTSLLPVYPYEPFITPRVLNTSIKAPAQVPPARR